MDVVVERHEALRSTLVRADDDTTLLTVRTQRSKWPRLEVRAAEDGESARAAAQAFHDAHDNDPFRYGAPLFRALLVTYPRGGVLYVGANHAVADGLSHQILYSDLVAAYNGEPLPPVDRRYLDFLAWHADRGWARDA
ncbi:MAG: condensation domain-containing protein, partial [Verrucomicrobiota bacterium]